MKQLSNKNSISNHMSVFHKNRLDSSFDVHDDVFNGLALGVSVGVPAGVSNVYTLMHVLFFLMSPMKERKI